ncbi:MAG: putative signaling protein [Chloroflexi bacterium]|nr:MAG: putative signaling protein [Chloroflexota bacterium]
MSEQGTQVRSPARTTRFRGSLVRTVVIGLLLISLVPVLVIGTLTIIRTSNSLQNQTYNQLAFLSDTFSSQIEQFAAMRTKAINEINQSTSFDENLAIILDGDQNPSYNLAQRTITDNFNQYIVTPTEKIFDLVTIVDSAGTVLVSSNRSLLSKNLTDNDFIKSLYQTNQVVLSHSAGGLYPDKLVLITTKINKNVAGSPAVTIIGFTSSALPSSFLNSSQLFFTKANAYYFGADQSLVSLDPKTNSAIIEDVGAEYKTTLEGYINQSGSGKDFQYLNKNGAQVLSYIRTLPSVESSLILEVAQSEVLSQIQSQLPFTFLILIVLILLSGIVVFLGARSIVIPLVALANNAQSFTGGDWSFRAKVNRKDEIGLLAYSFNLMVDQLTGFYRSLEEKVEERTKQLRAVSEIGQVAGSAPNQLEIFKLASQLINEKFNFTYNAIYQVDDISKTAILTANYANSDNPLPEKNLKLPLNAESLIGWTASTKLPRLTDNISTDSDLTNKKGVFSSTRSALAVPILLDQQVVGIIDLQSDSEKAFDNESITVFTTLANQLSTSLKNIQAYESAQVDLKENIALYKSSRQITNAQTVEEVNNYITGLFSQTSFVSIFFSVEHDQIRLMNITDPKGTQLDLTLRGLEIPFAKGLLRLPDEGVVVLDDLKAESDYGNLAVFYERRGCQSVALLPVFFGDDLSYILAIGSRDLEPLSLLQMQPYGNLTNVIGKTLERINLLSLLNRRVNELTALSAIGQSAAKSIDLEEFFLRLHNQIRYSIGETIGVSVAVNDAENQKIDIPYYFDYDQVEISPYPYSDDLVSQVITKQGAILHDDASASGLYTIESPQKKLIAKSLLGIPLVISNKVLGALMLFDTTTANRFSEDDLDLLKTLAPQIAASIQNAELISSQQQALLAFEQERFLLNSLLKNIPDQIAFKNNNGEYIRVSNSVASALNINNPDALIGKVEETLLPQDPNNPYISKDLDVIETGLPIIGNIEKSTDLFGKESWSLISKIPLLTDKGVAESILKISRDVTDLISVQNIAQRRADQLLTASEIARETTTGSLDINETLKRLVELVRTRFGFYHASVFLVDAIGEYAVLRESTGEAGALLKQTGHKLAVASSSIVGQSTSRGEPVVVNDVTQTENYYPNPLLPKTRSELAIPLKIGNQIFGALDVQSEKEEAFNQEDINILQVLADQLTVTIQNANLYSKTQRTLERHRLIHQITTSAGQSATVEDAIRNAVHTLNLTMPDEKISYLTPEENGTLRVRAFAGYTTTDTTTLRVKPGTGAIGTAAIDRTPQRIHDTSSSHETNPLAADTRSILAVPVVYANTILGVINVESTAAGAFDEDDEEVITTLANTLASILSNIKLVDQIRLQVERQRQLYDITSKIRRSVDMETIMRTSVSEICNALNIRKGSIHLKTIQESPSIEGFSTSEKEVNK